MTGEVGGLGWDTRRRPSHVSGRGSRSQDPRDPSGPPGRPPCPVDLVGGPRARRSEERRWTPVVRTGGRRLVHRKTGQGTVYRGSLGGPLWSTPNRRLRGGGGRHPCRESALPLSPTRRSDEGNAEVWDKRGSKDTRCAAEVWVKDMNSTTNLGTAVGRLHVTELTVEKARDYFSIQFFLIAFSKVNVNRTRNY